jgi:hypothetical protein
MKCSASWLVFPSLCCLATSATTSCASLPPPRRIACVSIEVVLRVTALRLMCVCVRQVWLWSYRGDDGATTSRGALRTLYGWRSWMYPAVTHGVNGLLCVVTEARGYAITETHNLRHAGVFVCARQRVSMCARASRAHLWHICACGRLHCSSQCREHVVGHLTLHRTLCPVVTFSEGMKGVTSSSASSTPSSSRQQCPRRAVRRQSGC